MLGFRVDIWYSVKHNGKFVVNNNRLEIVHARNADEARRKIVLEPAKQHIVGDLTIDSSAEFIYSIEKIGTVKVVTRKFYEYSNGLSREIPPKEIRLRQGFQSKGFKEGE